MKLSGLMTTIPGQPSVKKQHIFVLIILQLAQNAVNFLSKTGRLK